MSWVVTALIVTSVAAGYSAYETKQQSKQIKKQAEAQEAGARKMEEDTERNRLQTIMRNQKRRGAVGEMGLRDTILTGPLGLPYTGQATAGQKTLLGL